MTHRHASGHGLRVGALAISFGFGLLVAGCSDGDAASTPGGDSGVSTGQGAASSSSATAGPGGAGGEGSTVGAGGDTGAGGATTGSGGAGGGCSMGQGGEGGAVDPDLPCEGLVAPRVAWLTQADPEIVLTEPVELLWGFQFVVAVPAGDQASYTLEHERCAKPAGEPETCDKTTLVLGDAACEVRFAPKYGIDPSQYFEGDNAYAFKMRLIKGCNVVSDDAFSTVVKYSPQ